MKNILITGGAGFIGYHLAKHHVRQKDRVWIVDNLKKNQQQYDSELTTLLNFSNVVFCPIDLCKPIEKDVLAGEYDVVYHLAAINGTRRFYEYPYEVCRDNVLLTINLLEGLTQISVEKVVYSSSSEVYSGALSVDLLSVPTSEDVPVVFPQPTDPRYSYGTSKFLGEFLVTQFGLKYNIPTSIIRYHNIYGPRMGTEHAIPEFIERLISETNPFPVYGGTETRSFCFIEDAVQATVAVADTPETDSQIIHIGNPDGEIKINRVVGMLKEIMDKQVTLKEVGGRSASVSRRCPDTKKLERLTGYKVKTSLRDGLMHTVNWYLQNME